MAAIRPSQYWRTSTPLRPMAAMAEQPAGLPAEPAAAESEAGDLAGPGRSPPSRCCPRVRAVEPVLLLATVAISLQNPLCTQYLWDRLGPGDGADSPENGHGCTNGTHFGQQEVEVLVAHWKLYINLAGFFVGLFSVTLFGPWSDSVGRRPILVLPALGMALQAGVYLLVMYLKLPVWCLLLGRVLSGLSGDYNLVLAGCFAYVADVSSKHERTFRVAILEACLGLAGMVASLIGGEWLKAQGYVAPFWLAFAVSICAALYSAFGLQESVTQTRPGKLFTFRHYLAVYHLYVAPARGWVWKKLALYSLVFFLVITVHFGTREILVLFELSFPLCWGSDLIGFGSAAYYLTYLSSLGVLRLLQLCMADSWVAEAGLLSSISGLVVFSLASTTPLMFTGYGLLFLSIAVTPVVRSKLSKLVGETEQGALFAAVACIEGLCALVATGVFNSLYPACLHFMKGFPFLFGAFVLLVPAAIVGWIEIQDSKPEYRQFAEPPVAEAESTHS